MRDTLAPPILLLSVVAFTTGCARDEATYPSLAPRAAERLGFAEPTVAPPVPVTVDPALDTRLAGFAERLAAIVRGFDGDAARAKRAADVAGSTTVGSEAWVAAQTALASLDDWRAQAGGLASEIDDAARERAATIGTAYPPLDALRTQADAAATRQGEIIATIGATLPTPR